MPTSKFGKLTLASDMLDDMTKRYLMITVKIYKSLNASFANDSDILRLFWGHVVEREPCFERFNDDLQNQWLYMWTHYAQWELASSENNIPFTRGIAWFGSWHWLLNIWGGPFQSNGIIYLSRPGDKELV
ncbi:hypothetical protein IFM89_013354 [Coptis chinensis]|uniref:Uncharacterized protein n=1 Tax=Coptis chinensis TaxID=261450 RepID=A0A835LVJ6_9MAGN|nr:hypothetical protein IFM89_013354 [Coptis chinensis]